MLDNSIGDGAIKIACIQTIPGYEGKVKSELEMACEESPEIHDFTLFKGIGSFDIILIYLTNDFGSHLRTAGPIKHILKSNLLLCYPYLRKNVKEIFNLLKDRILTSFCLLKISPGLKKDYPGIDKTLRNFVPQQDSNLFILGSLGWNELIMMHCTNNMVDIYERLSSTWSIYLKTKQESISAILKTLSFIGINYDYLPPTEVLKKGFKNTVTFLQKTTELNKAVKDSRKSDTSLSIDVTAKNIYVRDIKHYFESKDFKISYLIGKSDIVVRPGNDEMTWSHFLATILIFRFQFKKKIFSTNTRICFQREDIKVENVKDLPALIKPFDFDYHKLEEIFGTAMASNLANQFYTLNALFQNPLCGSLYADMLKYPSYVLDVGESLVDDYQNNERFALVSGSVIRRGAELRSYGTYETIEEVTGRFSEFKGGCQLSLLAMELLPSIVLENIDIEWMGFITVAGEPKFSHINEVINVTPEALWNPQKWWALYHEIAHIIIERQSGIVGFEIPSIQDFLSTRDLSCYNDIIELSAEVIGFELGLFGNYELYFRLLWNYLNELDPFQEIPISSYAIRTFFIELFEGHFRTHTNINKIRKTEFHSLDFLYNKFVSHMDRIEKTIGKKIFQDKYFIAAQNVKMFKDLYPFCEHLSKEMLNLKLRPSKRLINTNNTKSVVDSLINGRIWWDEINSPQAILSHLFKINDIKFNTRIATILSFWNQQMLRYRERLQ
jgi:hypothetical protein